MPVFKKSLFMVLIIAGIALGFTGYFISAGPQETVRLDEGRTPEKAAKVTVYVTGAVKSPGVVELSADARIGKAIEACGGALPTADLENVNLAKPIADGMQIRVPESVKSGGAEPFMSKSAASGDSVNINTADAAGLAKLPGVGPATANRIIECRNEHGLFESPEDIQKVRGIGPSKYEKMKDKITI
ncbi:MAG: ComEA family DNA-binding protein [Schwartzia sp.]|nr:ComEA family DNA-binding protein [Schwartzia sp. (in: firmicutes)]